MYIYIHAKMNTQVNFGQNACNKVIVDVYHKWDNILYLIVARLLLFLAYVHNWAVSKFYGVCHDCHIGKGIT